MHVWELAPWSSKAATGAAGWCRVGVDGEQPANAAAATAQQLIRTDQRNTADRLAAALGGCTRSG